jgi:hypothetical protein
MTKMMMQRWRREEGNYSVSFALKDHATVIHENIEVKLNLFQKSELNEREWSVHIPPVLPPKGQLLLPTQLEGG